MLQGVLDLGRGGTFQSRTERDIVVRTSLARLEQLDIGDQALYFGRIDRLPDPVDDAAAETPLLGESFHIGRLAVSGPDHEPLVVDWRAPVAEPFYRATGLDPQGLARRRHLSVRGRAVLGLEDEYFVDPEGAAGRRCPGRCRRRTVQGRRGAPPLRRARPGRPRSSPVRARPGAHGPDGRHHRDHPARAGRDHPLTAARGSCRPGWARHREDGGGAAPCRLPALHPPLSVGAPGRSRRGTEPVVPALHRAGPSFPRRDRGEPVDGLGPGARGARARGRRPRRRQAEGRRAHGQGADPGRADPRAPAAPGRRGPLRRRGAAPAGPDDRGHRGHGPSPAGDAQRPSSLRGVARPARVVGRVPRQARPERRRRGGRRPDRRGTEGPGPAAAPRARSQRCPRPDVAAPVAPRVPPRSPRRPRPPGGRRQGDPDSARGAAAVPAPQHVARDGAVDGGRRGAHRRGAHAARPTAGASGPGAVQAARGGHGVRDRDSGRRAWRPRRSRRPAWRPRPRTTSAPSATSSWTRCRISRRCSCACWPAARCRAP